MSKRTCSKPDCERPYSARGWCNKHYQQWYTPPPAITIQCPGEEGFECLPGIVAKGLCRRCYDRQWTRAHREQLIEQKRRYYAANREEMAERARDRRQAYPERTAAIRRRYRQANTAKLADAYRQWRLANLDKKAENQRRRKARESDVLTIDFTTDELAQRMAFWGDRCWMCGGPYESVDHVIAIARGGPHCLSNLRPACLSCNASKGDRRVSKKMGSSGL